MLDRSMRRPGATLLALALAVGACDGGQDSLAPTDSETAATPAGAPAGEAADTAASGPTAALVTSQRIVFSSTRTGQFDLFKADPQGGNTVRLTSAKASDTEPAWSFDNKRIALVRPRPDGNGATHNDIYIINADGSNGHWARSKANSSELSHPRWSPDGSRLVLTMSIGSDDYVAYLNLATGQLSAYSTGYGGLPGMYPSYTSAGQIVYVGPTGGTIIRMNADGSNRKTLLTSTERLADPALSPDGKKLAYAVETSWITFTHAIRVRNLATGVTTQLSKSLSSDRQPSWSPDGSRIAFSSLRSTKTQIWTMSATGGTPTRVTNSDGNEFDPSWSH